MKTHPTLYQVKTVPSKHQNQSAQALIFFLPVECACDSHKAWLGCCRLPFKSLRVLVTTGLSTSFCQERPFHHSRCHEQGNWDVSGHHTRSWYLSEDVYHRSCLRRARNHDCFCRCRAVGILRNLCPWRTSVAGHMSSA